MHKTLSVSNPFVMCSDGGLLNGASLSFVRQIVFASRGQYGPLMAEPACGCCMCGDPHTLHLFSSERKTGSDGLLLEVAHSLGKHQSGEERSGAGARCRAVGETGHSSAPSAAHVDRGWSGAGEGVRE